MNSLRKNLIEYSGIKVCPVNNKKNFKQTNVEEVTCIPSQKPDIEQINKIQAKAIVVDYEIVKTPVGKSVEGQIMTGYKLLICGDIKLRVDYVALKPTQPVHTAHFTIPFCAYLVLPKDFNPNKRISVNAFIEDIYSDQLDCRCFYNNITMMVIADIC